MKFTYSRTKPLDKRRGADFWIKSLTWFAVIGWLTLISGLVVLEKAKPQIETFLDQRYKVHIDERFGWDERLSNIFLLLMVFGVVISFVGLLVNSTRMKRQNDEYRLSIILVGVISIIGLLFYFLGIR
jgi:hypothetical protein